MNKERPILMSAPMVRAILTGKKTQTRRLVKSRNDLSRYNKVFVLSKDEYNTDIATEFKVKVVAKKPMALFFKNFINDLDVECPYGNVGDRLWVRETWRVGAWQKDALAVDYLADGYARKEWIPVDAKVHTKLVNQSILDAERSNLIPLVGLRYQWEPGKAPTRTRPAIFMPRWASRILLEITQIRVERLQDISWEDCESEGILKKQEHDYTVYFDYSKNDYLASNPKESYQSLIEKINGPETWEKNPWVWVVEFRVIEVKGGLHENL